MKAIITFAILLTVGCSTEKIRQPELVYNNDSIEHLTEDIKDFFYRDLSNVKSSESYTAFFSPYLEDVVVTGEKLDYENTDSISDSILGKPWARIDFSSDALEFFIAGKRYVANSNDEYRYVIIGRSHGEIYLEYSKYPLVLYSE